MRAGQRVKVLSERGFLTNLEGNVEVISWLKGRSFYSVRFPFPYHDVLYQFKIWELGRMR